MNFTCISPKDNGYNYNVRYNEPIIIPENASVSMNFAQFERDNKIRFTTAQTIRIVADTIYPYWDYHNNGAGKVDGAWRQNVPRNNTDLLFEIPAGEYNLNDGENSLQAAICKALGTSGDKGIFSLFNTTNSIYGINPQAKNRSLTLPNFMLIIPPIDRAEKGLEIGFTHSGGHSAFGLHADHQVGMEAQGHAFAGRVRKSNAVADVALAANGLPQAGTYNSYCLSTHNYFHIGVNANQYIKLNTDNTVVIKDGGYDSLSNSNTVQFVCNQNIDVQEGNVFVGLYSEQCAGVDVGGADESTLYEGVGLTEYINRAQMVSAQDEGTTGGFYPECFFGVEITGGAITTDGSVEAGKPRMINIIGGNNHIFPITTGISNMKVFESIPLDAIRDPHDNSPVSIGFQMYLDKNNKNFYHHGEMSASRQIRVYLTDSHGGHKVIYDTNTKYPHQGATFANGSYITFPNQFFSEGNSNADPATISLAKAQAQTPFSVIACATKQGEGVAIEYSRVGKPAETEDNNTSTSILEEYHLELSEQLGKLFLPTSGTLTMTSKFPAYVCLDDVIRYYNTEEAAQGGFNGLNMDSNEFIYNKNSIIPQFRTDQFSVVLNNLPIKSFKNTSDKSKSGYRKPIVSLIPHPFSGAVESNEMGGVIQGSYQPSYGIVNRLSNQAITTNNFDILILDLETDKPAEQLTKSVINFTIQAE